jgi:hypothetical protein
MPVWPHSRHDPVAEQTVPDAQRSAPPVAAQHGSPPDPQGVQLPPTQAKPAAQVVPQQGCWAAPQPAHLPALHMPGLVPALPPAPVVGLPHEVPSATQLPL